MPSFVLPPDTRAVGTGDPPGDMNKIIDALLILQSFYTLGLVPVAASGDTSGVTDTAAINAALANGAAALGPATYTTNTQVTLGTSQALRGAGPATVVKLANSSGASVNMIANTSDAQYCRISDLTVDGNKANQTGAWQCGIVLQNPGQDGRHMVRGVRIQNPTGDCLVQTGRGSSQFSDIQTFGPGGFGLNVNQDCYYTGINVGSSGIDGVIEQGSSNQWSACKFWFAGAALVSSRGAGANLLTVNAPSNSWDGGGIAGLTFSLANGYGNGFNVANISGAAIGGAGGGGTMSACYFQDNARAGYCNVTTSPRRILTAVVADSNNNCGTSGGVPNGGYAGFDLAASNCVITGSSTDRNANVNHQAAALNIVTGANSNSVRLTFSGTLNDGSNMPPLTAGSVVTKTDLDFKAAGRSFFGPGFASSYTPDPYSAEVHAMTLTGAVTVNNPALSGTNTTGLFLHPGQKITLQLTQDNNGGHAVSLGGAYRINSKSFTTTANATTSIEFIYDGTSWQATG